MNSRADRYWLLTAPDRLVLPPVRPPRITHRGTVVAFLGGGRDPEISERRQEFPQGPLAEAVGAGQAVRHPVPGRSAR